MAKTPKQSNLSEQDVVAAFQSLHQWWKTLCTDVGDYFKQHPIVYMALEGLNPVVAGLVLGLVYLLLPLFGVQGSYQLLVDFSKKASEHADKSVGDVGLIGFGVVLAAGSSFLGHVAKKLVAIPLLRLTHHALGVAIGALVVVLFVARWRGEVAVWDTVLIGMIGVTAMAVIAFIHLLVEFVKGQFLVRLGALPAFPPVAFVLGLIVIGIAVNDLRTPSPHKAAEPQCQGTANHATTPPRGR